MYCGEKAGLLSNEHKACREKADGEMGKGALRIEQAILNDHPSSETIGALVDIRRAGCLDPHRDVKGEWLRRADKAAMERSRQEPISPQSLDEIANIFVYLQPDFLTLGEGLLNWPGYVSLDFSSVIYQVLHGEVPYVPPGTHTGFMLARSENLILRRNAELAEYRHTVQRGNYQSISLPVGGGIYYRLGTTTPRISQATLQVVDQGKMVITDQAIYFGGNLHTFRIAYEDILRLEPYRDAFEIHEAYGSGKLIIPGTLGFDDGWYFYALISAFIDRARVHLG
jgi:hypothetical protein